MDVVIPEASYLESYVDALRRGWSPDNLRPEVAQLELEAIERSSSDFLASLDDPGGHGAPIQLPDGSTVARLPGFRRWMWDGEFCGSIGFRWQPGTTALPPTCMGHTGYAVVPWKRGRGYATAALAHMLGEARSLELEYVEITTTPDNIASQRVIVANGGLFIEEFRAPISYGHEATLRYRIPLAKTN
ncbi:MAG TPA: GNAT family N-acetyltransferase [Candidatus Tumulicola sp.]